MTDNAALEVASRIEENGSQNQTLIASILFTRLTPRFFRQRLENLLRRFLSLITFASIDDICPPCGVPFSLIEFIYRIFQ